MLVQGLWLYKLSEDELSTLVYCKFSKWLRSWKDSRNRWVSQIRTISYVFPEHYWLNLICDKKDLSKISSQILFVQHSNRLLNDGVPTWRLTISIGTYYRWEKYSLVCSLINIRIACNCFREITTGNSSRINPQIYRILTWFPSLHQYPVMRDKSGCGKPQTSFREDI